MRLIFIIIINGFVLNVESGLDWNSAKDVWYTCKMYYNEVPINVSVGRNNENTQKTPAEIFKFINKMIEASKTDKTIANFGIYNKKVIREFNRMMS